MKLPDVVSNILQPKPEHKDMLLSLLLSPRLVVASAWFLKERGKPHILTTVSSAAPDNWDERIQTCDRLLGKLEDSAGTQDLHKVVLGLASAFLTESADIKKKSVRTSKTSPQF